MKAYLSKSRGAAKDDPESTSDRQTDHYSRHSQADGCGHLGRKVTRYQRQVCAAPIAILQLNGNLVATSGTIHDASYERATLSIEKRAGIPNVVVMYHQEIRIGISRRKRNSTNAVGFAFPDYNHLTRQLCRDSANTGLVRDEGTKLFGASHNCGYRSR